jgi:hypothetical protein
VLSGEHSLHWINNTRVWNQKSDINSNKINYNNNINKRCKVEILKSLKIGTVLYMKNSILWDVTWSGESQPVFLNNVSPPSSSSNSKPADCFMLVAFYFLAWLTL